MKGNCMCPPPPSFTGTSLILRSRDAALFHDPPASLILRSREVALFSCPPASLILRSRDAALFHDPPASLILRSREVASFSPKCRSPISFSRFGLCLAARGRAAGRACGKATKLFRRDQPPRIAKRGGGADPTPAATFPSRISE